MSKTQSESRLLERRGELLAELFFQELHPEFVARPTTDFTYDFFVGFPNANGGINNVAVEVKITERLVKEHYPIPRPQYDRWAFSNIPVLLLVIDVKENRIFYAWPSPRDAGRPHEPASGSVSVELIEVNDSSKKVLLEQLTSVKQA